MGFFDKFRRKKQSADERALPHEASNNEHTVDDRAANTGNPSAYGYAAVDAPQPSVAAEQLNLPEPASLLLGFVLLNQATFDPEQIITNMRVEWGIQIDGLEPSENMVFQIADMQVALAYMPGPIPDREVEETCKYNLLWPEAEQVVATQQAHVIVTVMGVTDPLLGHALFTQLVASVLKLEQAIAYYAPPMVMSAQSYLESAQMLQDRELPVQLWVFLGMYTSEDKKGNCAYTVGLNHFGKDEMEIINSSQDLGDVFELMLNITTYVVGSNVVLHDGETLGYSAEHKLSLVRSPGVATQGDSIKIGY
ncbi:DUF4261 domain-containing protein [Paenibacillus campi]|uniref:DUF4261 domain-containing protein n=1 Tax=Paenibacillus campi TaxID=3106031 RepID=UPI002AFDF90C|nr:DUF4261 domain-containing protein [Paenibacillus sp. SGZ-1014]